MEEKNEKGKKEYALVQVPTGQALAIKTPSEEVLSTEEALVELLNKVEFIQQALK